MESDRLKPIRDLDYFYGYSYVSSRPLSSRLIFVMVKLTPHPVQWHPSAQVQELGPPQVQEEPQLQAMMSRAFRRKIFKD